MQRLIGGSPLRFLFDSPGELPDRSAEIVVVGSGVAGLRSALALAGEYSVRVLTKTETKASNTNRAQGGIAAVLSGQDSIQSHYEDTLEAGDGLCNRNRVRELVKAGPDQVYQLMDLGAEFDQNHEGNLALGREGGHRSSRIVHGRGDATGALVEDTLVDRVRRSPRITLQEETMLVDLITDDTRGYGAVIQRSGSFELLWFRALVLATGGLGQLYRETTNHDVVTGDGMAVALRAGLPLKDLEFVQFHPTTLYVAGGSRFLISEALRGAGAKLVDSRGNRFMKGIHPMAELAPRDVVSRTSLRRMIQTKTECVYLDATHLSEEEFTSKFPTITQTCSEYDINPAFDRIPVRPCAHYSMGGIKATLRGETDLRNVFAVGEVACTGVHGANRLASNSILEGMVMGDRIQEIFSGFELPSLEEKYPELKQQSRERALDIDDMTRSLKSLMWRKGGILRNKEEMEEAKNRLSDWLALVERHRLESRREIELANLLMLGRCLLEAALTREESRGAHYREDFPDSREEYQKHTLISYPGYVIQYENKESSVDSIEPDELMG